MQKSGIDKTTTLANVNLTASVGITNVNVLSGQTGSTTINGELKVKEDIIVDGASLKDWMATVSQRLLILEPKKEYLEKYSALKEAYDQYRTLEALVNNLDKK